MMDELNQKVVLVTGPSGAGRTTAINALEDLGFEVINNLPLSLLDRLLDGTPIDRPLAIGLDVRNRDFAVDSVIGAIDRLSADSRIELSVLYLDCSEDVLIRRYSETRRRHPLAADGGPMSGIQREQSLLVPVRARADALIDTTDLTPHDLKAEVAGLYETAAGRPLTVSVQSFSYKRGLPRGMDIVLDCRFLNNPHWDPALRSKNGRDTDVDSFVAADPRFAAFFDGVLCLVKLLLPAYKEEGKSHLSIGFGCTGGQHRSVAVAERLSKALAEDGWQVSKRHRELERQAIRATS